MQIQVKSTWPEPKPRREYDIEGYLESDRDYLENNNELAVKLLDLYNKHWKQNVTRK